ncbi:MAG: peptide chain release factor N(5)-glutamine methyltransferase [Oligoflexia bacterium]|nr:peptide chain release factor N(5)-glutamine methyltransferase [Oligoflexia bacterium]
MGAFGQDLPTSFDSALRLAAAILSRNSELISRGVIQAEAELLVIEAYRRSGHASLTRMELYSRLADRFPEAAGEALIIMAGARSEGKILQHITGKQVFLDHEYEVGPDVLVPRPETEAMVAHAVKILAEQFDAPRSGIEIGLGSGIISIELLSRFPSLRMISSELTEEAARRAGSNANRILGSGSRGLGRLQILRAPNALDVWGAFRSLASEGKPRAQFLVSNPPYLAPSDPIDREVLEQEPRTALFPPGTDPLHFYREIAGGLDEFLEPTGIVFLEIAPERSVEARALFARYDRDVRVYSDLNGRDRFIEVRMGFVP